VCTGPEGRYRIIVNTDNPALQLVWDFYSGFGSELDRFDGLGCKLLGSGAQGRP